MKKSWTITIPELPTEVEARGEFLADVVLEVAAEIRPRVRSDIWEIGEASNGSWKAAFLDDGRSFRFDLSAEELTATASAPSWLEPLGTAMQLLLVPTVAFSLLMMGLASLGPTMPAWVLILVVTAAIGVMWFSVPPIVRQICLMCGD